MTIFRTDESPVVSIAFEVAAWACVILFGLTVGGAAMMLAGLL